MAGILTRAQLRAAVQDNLGRSQNLTLRSGTVLSDRINIWIEWAQIKIKRQHDFLFKTATTSTVADQDCYPFPTDYDTIYTIRMEDGLQSVKLGLLMPWEFDRLVAKPDELPTQRPSYYVPFKESGHFELFPVPDAVYTMRIRYSYRPTLLTVDTQKSDYTDLDDVIVYYATSEGFKSMQELKDAAFWQARGDEALAEEIASTKSSLPDWQPVAQGFSLTPTIIASEYYNNPFIDHDPGVR